MNQAPDAAMLESLARDTDAPIDTIVKLYQRERDALAQDATITNYITLLAVRRVRDQLLHAHSPH
jgi:hypothetical protein